MMKKSLFLLLFFISLAFGAESDYPKFIDSQLQLVYEINDNNITQERIKEIIAIQNVAYEKSLDILMINKQTYIDSPKLYESEIFSLKKVMSINKRAGNTNALLRDEIKSKSYYLLQTQSILIKNVLLSLDAKNIDSFKMTIDSEVSTAEKTISQLYLKDYSYVEQLTGESRTAIQAKKNLKEFYALRDINADMINNLYKLQNKMYRLNKYTKYHLIGLIIYINNLSVVKHTNNLLEFYGLTVIKLLFIVFMSLLIYGFRKITYMALQSYILTMDVFHSYSEDIMRKLYKPLEMLVIIVNINMIIYVYNDFSSIELFSKAFSVTYVSFVTFIIYKFGNTITGIKLLELQGENQIKNEMVNVGIKIINFIIVLIGFLFVLYFSGVNLTAVLSGLGIGGFAVAFAAKDTISNFFGTLSVLFSDVFSQGDWIVVGNNEGVVVEIGLRVTTLRTFDNALIAIPNGTFATAEVKNWNRRTLGRRIKMSLGIKYDSKSADIKKAIQEIREMLDKHPDIATSNTKYTYRKHKSTKLISKDDHEGVKKTLLVYLDEFGPSSMNILVYCYTKSVTWKDWLEVKEDVMHKIMEIFEKNSLEFAFPSLSIYNENQI